MTMDNNVTRPIAIAPGPLVFAGLLSLLVAGCATPWEKSALLKDNNPSTTSVKGPQERSLQNWFKKKQDEDNAAGKPLKEPVARYGPFVMNTPDEIRQAIADYQSGRF